MGIQTYVTNNTKLFSRDFHRNEFFYCEKCKTFTFANCSEESVAMGTCVDPCPIGSKNNSTQCNSSLSMMQTILYPGDILDNSANSKY